MKTLTEHIKENSETKLFSKLDLSGIPNRETNSKEERLALGREQENFFVKRFIEAYPKYFKTKRLAEENGKEDSVEDLKNGDIVIKDKSGIKYYIDLKVSKFNSKSTFGSISLNSILNFGITEPDKHGYICVNKNGTEFKFIRATNVKKVFNETPKCLHISKNNKRLSPIYLNKSLNKYLDKYTEAIPPREVSLEDYTFIDLYKDYFE